MRLHERRNLEGKNNKEEREEGDWKLETATLTAIKISKYEAASSFHSHQKLWVRE